MIELLEQRNYNSRTFLHEVEAGKKVLQSHVGHIHYKDGDDFKEISWDLIWDEVKRGWGFDTHSFHPFLPEYSDGIVEFHDKFQDKDQTITYKAICDKVKGELIESDETNPNFDDNPDNKGVLYKDAFGVGKDYLLYHTRSSLVKVATVNNPNEQTEDVKFRWEIAFPEKKIYRSENSEFVEEIVRNELTEMIDGGVNKAYELDITRDKVFDTGKQILIGDTLLDEKEWFTYLESFRAWDSKGNKIVVSTELINEDGKTYLEKTIPLDFLQNAVGRVFTDTATSYYPASGLSGVAIRGSYPDGVNETFSTIRTGNGTSNNVSASCQVSIEASGTTNQYEILTRFLSITDTSALPAGSTIASASFYVYGNAVAEGSMGQMNLHAFYCTTASNSAIANGDLQTNSSVTSLGSRAYADKIANAYNSIPLSSFSGINKGAGAITKIGLAAHWDILNDSTGLGWSSHSNTFWGISTSAQTGTSQDPYLEVMYEIANFNTNTKSVLFNGTNQYLSRADTAALDITGSMTLECWVKVNSQPASSAWNAEQTIFSKYSTTSDQRAYWLSYSRNGANTGPCLLFINSSAGTSGSIGEIDYTLTTGVWYYLATVYTASTGSVEFFVGTESSAPVSVGTATGLATSMYNSSAAFQIGGITNQNLYFDGYIDEPRVWNKTRTLAELTSFYNIELNTASGLVASWHLNDALTDSSGNGLTLTNNNTATYSTDIPNWWLSYGWKIRCAVTIDHTKLSGTVTDFPVLITKDNLPSDMFDTDGSFPALNGGGDIRFSSDTAGATQLACEVVSFVTDNNPANGSAEIWVKVPSISSSTDTVIYVWYNKSGVTQPAANTTYGSQGVWDANTKAVYHFNGNSNNSTSTAITMTDTAMTYGTSYGKISQGVLSNATTSRSLSNVDANTLIGTTAGGIGLWVKPTGTAPTAAVGDGNSYFNGIITADTSGYFWISRVNCTSGSGDRIYTGIYTQGVVPIVYTVDEWVHIFMSVSGGRLYAYKNGVEVTNVASTGFPTLCETMNILYTPGLTAPLTGNIDEFHYSNAARSADWIKAEYNTQASPATFAAAGTPVYVGPSLFKTFNGLAVASIKTTLGLASASVKTRNGLL